VGQLFRRLTPDKFGQGLDFQLAFGCLLGQLLLEYLLLSQLLVAFEEASVWLSQVGHEQQSREQLDDQEFAGHQVQDCVGDEDVVGDDEERGELEEVEQADCPVEVVFLVELLN